MLRSLSAESMLPESFSVLPSSNFAERASVRKDNQDIQLFSLRKVLGQPLCQYVIVDKAYGMTVWALRNPRGNGHWHRYQRAENACLG